MATKARPAKLQFNHMMLYVSDVGRSLEFYQGKLGFRLLQTFEYGGSPVYARIRSPLGQTTIALHGPEGDDAPMPTTGARLYFEVRQLDRFCKQLEKQGVKLKQRPKKMPWGWRHAYVLDPDGYEISLYWAGKARLQRN